MKTSSLTARLLLLATAWGWTGCSGNEGQPEKKEAAPELKAEVFTVPENAVLLDDLYATSVARGHESSYSQALFDGDATSYWATRPGAGPDEGLMLYFAEPTFVHQLSLKQASVQGAANLNRVEVYVNGNSVAKTHIEYPIVLDQQVRSLFIRFQGFEETTLHELDEGELAKFDSSLSTSPGYSTIFPRDKFAAIAEVELTDKDKKVLKVAPPVLVAAEVKASSSLEPEAAYGVQQLFDGRKEIAWSEGAEGNGVGENIHFSFKEPISISGIKVLNGYQRSAEHFEANARAKAITVKSDTVVSSLALRDAMGVQNLSFDQPITGSEFSFTIDGAYPGKKYQDLVLSELSLRQGEVRIKPVLNRKAVLEEELKEKTKGTVLAGILDRAINIEQGEYDYSNKRSFILRSDYTFVYYKQESLYEANANTDDETVADGNWEIKHLSPDSVVVRVFGKLANTSKRAEFYVGNTEESKTRIFQDFVSVTADRIEGQRFIDAIGVYE